ARLGEKKRLSAGAHFLEFAVKRLVEERTDAVDNVGRGSPDKQLVRLSVPKNGIRLATQESAVFRFLFEPFLGVGAGLAALAGTGEAARIGGAQPFQLDLRIGAEQVAGDLLSIDPEGKLQRIVDDVLGEVKARVENVVARD